MIKIVFLNFFLALTITGCVDSVIDSSENLKRDIDPGNIPMNYYADKTVKSLVVPPDLTKPNVQNSFRVSEFVSDINETIIDFSGSEKTKDEVTKILEKNSEISVQRSGQRRWLLVNKDSDLLWETTKNFLKQQGFNIKKSDKRIGIIETEFLENYPEIPEQSLGFFRSFLSKSLTARYTLPIIDKYRVRIEPVNENQTEIHLSLFSMQEKLAKSGNVESTLWEAYDKDIALETEMLYRLMVFISGDQVGSREKILAAKEDRKIKVEVLDNFNGYAKLRINASILDAWDNISWALDQLNIDIEDKDIKEKSFYINTVRTSDIGFMSKLLGTEALVKTYQLLVKSVDQNSSEVFFGDISGLNEQETKDFSYEFLNKIQKLF